jgi:hypothetical protein
LTGCANLNWIKDNMILEDIKSELKRLKTESKDLRKFGITMALILGVLTVISLYKGSWSFRYLLVLSGGFLLIGIIKPILLKKVYLGWMAIAITMGFFMTRIILTVLFYGVFTVTGVIVRLLNKDMLDQKYDANAETYWKKHEKPQDLRKHLERQF